MAEEVREQPIDIRTVSPQEYWSVFEKKWTSLLSYRYLGRVNAGLDSNEGAEQMALRHDMRNALGGIMVSPLCIFSPEAGGMNDDEFVPNPVIASMQIVDDARHVEKLRAIPETVRLGRQMGFSRTLIVDDADTSRVVAISEGMGVSLGGTPGSYEKVDNPPIAIEDSPDLPPLHQVFGAVRSPDGVVAPARAQRRDGITGRGPPPRPSAHRARGRGRRSGCDGGRDGPAADRELPLHVRGEGQGGAVPGLRRGVCGQ